MHGINHMTTNRSINRLTRRCFASIFKPNFTSYSHRSILCQEPSLASRNSSNSWWAFINMTIIRHYRIPTTHVSSLRCVVSEGTPKFETVKVDLPKRNKKMERKRLRLKREREKQRIKLANKKNPGSMRIKRSKTKDEFANAGERLIYKLERARIKESKIIEKLKRYEVPRLQGPTVKPVELTGEERFYMMKMAQKRTNYAPVGRRGIFGGVILNMHLHWKKHETVTVYCKPCKPGQIQEYANEIARLSGGIPIKIIGDDTIVFYRGKDYAIPVVKSPIDTLSKRKAYRKSILEQKLDTLRHFMAVSEKELQLYHMHIALYGDPKTVVSGAREGTKEPKTVVGIDRTNDKLSQNKKDDDEGDDDDDDGEDDDDDDDDDEDDDDDMSLSDMNYTDESSAELDSCNEET